MKKRSKRTTARQLKQMAKYWQDNPEIAAANRTRNPWVKLTAHFKVAQKAAKNFTEAINKTLQVIADNLTVQTKIDLLRKEFDHVKNSKS